MCWGTLWRRLLRTSRHQGNRQGSSWCAKYSIRKTLLHLEPQASWYRLAVSSRSSKWPGSHASRTCGSARWQIWEPCLRKHNGLTEGRQAWSPHWRGSAPISHKRWSWNLALIYCLTYRFDLAPVKFAIAHLQQSGVLQVQNCRNLLIPVAHDKCSSKLIELCLFEATIRGW